jgi:GNAT superfamily N-acetyltransferase
MIFVCDGQGTIVGGLTGGTYWGWLYIGRLWIAESLRGQGFGSTVLAEAEREAVRRGCHSVYLDTQDFQALPFYRNRGYVVYGEFEDMPMGHTRYSLRKTLGPS